MLKDILEFFKKEKIYAFLFLFVVLTYGFFYMQEKQAREFEKREPKSKVLKEFQAAEKSVQEKVKKTGSLDAYLQDRPDLVLVTNVFSVVVILLLLAGIYLNFLFFTRPKFRDSLQSPVTIESPAWKFSLLFKFIIWFFILMIFLSLGLAGLKKVIPEISENFFVLLHTTCAELLSFFLILYLLKREGGNLHQLGFQAYQGKWFREMRMGWTAYLIVIPLFGIVLIALLAVSEWLHYEPPPHPLVPIFLEEGQHSPFLVFYSLALAIFLGPFFEEVFFRGFCYPILKSRIGKGWGMVATSLFFALIHDNTFSFWPIFLLGLGLNYIYEKRGSLLASVTLHVTHNLLFLSYFFLAKDIISRELG